jgi:hypothetical protein
MNTTTTKPTLPELLADLRQIIDDNPIQVNMLEAVFNRGFTPKYVYVRNNTGLLSTNYLKKKSVYRIQISSTERKKNYPAAWVVDVTHDQVDWYVELPF